MANVLVWELDSNYCPSEVRLAPSKARNPPIMVVGFFFVKLENFNRWSVF
jgi:hypothetical protein